MVNRVDLRNRHDNYIVAEKTENHGLCVSNTHWLLKTEPRILARVQFYTEIKVRLDTGLPFVMRDRSFEMNDNPAGKMISNLLGYQNPRIEGTGLEGLEKTGLLYDLGDMVARLCMTGSGIKVWVNERYSGLLDVFNGFTDSREGLVILRSCEDFCGLLCPLQEMQGYAEKIHSLIDSETDLLTEKQAS